MYATIRADAPAYSQRNQIDEIIAAKHDIDEYLTKLMICCRALNAYIYYMPYIYVCD